MARVAAISQGTQTVSPHPTEVDLYYRVVVDQGEPVLLHLSTFGSADRQSAPKGSQSIQLDGDVALQLANLIHSTFGE